MGAWRPRSGFREAPPISRQCPRAAVYGRSTGSGLAMCIPPRRRAISDAQAVGPSGHDGAVTLLRGNCPAPRWAPTDGCPWELPAVRFWSGAHRAASQGHVPGRGQRERQVDLVRWMAVAPGSTPRVETATTCPRPARTNVTSTITGILAGETRAQQGWSGTTAGTGGGQCRAARAIRRPSSRRIRTLSDRSWRRTVQRALAVMVRRARLVATRSTGDMLKAPRHLAREAVRT